MKRQQRINIEFGRSADTLHDQLKHAGYTVQAEARDKLAQCQAAANSITELRDQRHLTKGECDNARARLERAINRLPLQAVRWIGAGHDRKH